MSPKATRLRVYVVCRPIFSGNEAHVRKLKVKELVNNNKESLGPLLQDIGETKLIETLRGLLEDRIFESEPRAKVEFPELFRPSPIRDAQRQASEIDAARSAAEALDEIASQDGHLPGSEDEESGGSEDDIAPEEIAVKHDTTELPAGMLAVSCCFCPSAANREADRPANGQVRRPGYSSFALSIVHAVRGPASHPHYGSAGS